jgi:AcrR family transcriptional regulator
MSAVAERAGVTRSTLYRHFRDEAAVFDACSAHWSAANPPPDPTPWTGIADPAERTRAALGALYPYYRRSEQMLANLLRDEETVDVVRERLEPFRDFLDVIRDILLAGRGLRGAARRRGAAAAGHALAFPTWQSLVAQGLSDDEAADLMTALVAGAR